MEKRKARIIFAKPGGTASEKSVSTRVSLPVPWVREMGVTKEERDVEISFDGKKIVIEKKGKNV